MKKGRIEIHSHLVLLIIRLAVLYVLWGGLRVGFYCYNMNLLEPITLNALPSIIKGSFIFDSASIFYVNILFIVLSLLPFHFTDKRWWQNTLAAVFTVTNGVALLVALTDIAYYPYKLARIAGDDIHFFSESNFIGLFFSIVLQYWYLALVLILFIRGLYWLTFVKVSLSRRRSLLVTEPVFYISKTMLLVVAMVMSVVVIRGFSVSKASFPITVSDAAKYVKPQYANLILSNPFSLIRTISHSLRKPKFSANSELFTTRRKVESAPYSAKGMNIMVITMESIASAHIKSLSDNFKESDVSYTPFLDSLFSQGLLMTNAYQSGIRSLDAMPALWSSIPTFKQQFLSLPQSQGTYHSLPHILKEEGYTTAFMHGAESSSMSFKSFGQMAGIDNFVFREEYEAVNGGKDFDGKWGIWDDKFLPFALEQVNSLPEPFFTTIFTLSSHHPFILPEGFEGRYPEGNAPIHKMIAYTDEALRLFFEEAKKEEWYDNTLFIFMADHGSGADNDKWRAFPYSHRIPIFFFTPNGTIPSMKLDKVASQIDIMPSILSLIDYNDEFFAFGNSIFSEGESYAAMAYNETYCVVGQDAYYQFNDEGLVHIQSINELVTPEHSSSKEELYKAYINNYFRTLEQRNYKIDE